MPFSITTNVVGFTTGPTGPTGPIGPIGPQGIQGEVGPTGPSGDSSIVTFAHGTLANMGDIVDIDLTTMDDWSGGLIYINAEKANKEGNSSMGFYTRDAFITVLETTNNSVATFMLSDDGKLNITSTVDESIDYVIKIIKIISTVTQVA